MSILDRIRRITKANINLLLDKVEVPEQELESKIKELEETIQQGRESAASYGATFRRLEHELDGLKQQQQTLAGQAETALKGGDEGTARKALTEKVKLGERIAQMNPGVEQGRKTFEQLRDNIIKLLDQLKAAKLKLQDLKSRKRAAEAQKAFDQQLGKTMAVGSEGVAFDRLEDDVLQVEAEVEIRQDITGDALSDLELAERSRDIQVEAELQAMKEHLEKDQE
ncbi:MAG: PspA/IM30 family protein [Planctomycetota bacterium]|jgi:phage shock protein A